MSKLPSNKYNMERATEEEVRQVFSVPAEFSDMWPRDKGHEDIIKHSLAVFKGEVNGELCGVAGVRPFSLTSQRAWVWTRSSQTLKAARLYKWFAPLYIKTVLEYLYPVLYATVCNDQAQRYAEWLGFERDVAFEKEYGVTDRKIFVRKLNG